MNENHILQIRVNIGDYRRKKSDTPDELEDT